MNSFLAAESCSNISTNFSSAPTTIVLNLYILNGLPYKPGITGLWQISGRSNVTFRDRLEMDMKYHKEAIFSFYFSPFKHKYN